MPKIKLFSGMDFSGKSTIIQTLDKIMPDFFKCQQRFLIPNNIVQALNIQNIKLPNDLWKPLFQSVIQNDVIGHRINTPTLQDGLWGIKYIATLLGDDKRDNQEEVEQLWELVKQYPSMDSFYLVTKMEERVRRFNARKVTENGISETDKLVLSPAKFEKIDMFYKEIICELFPNTKIIDTTSIEPTKMAIGIIKDKHFLKDL